MATFIILRHPVNILVTVFTKPDNLTNDLESLFLGFLKWTYFVFPNKILKGFLFFSIFQNPVVLFLADITYVAYLMLDLHLV